MEFHTMNRGPPVGRFTKLLSRTINKLGVNLGVGVGEGLGMRDSNLAIGRPYLRNLSLISPGDSSSSISESAWPLVLW